MKPLPAKKTNKFNLSVGAPEISAERQRDIGKIMGLIPLHDTLPEEMPAIEKIKVYAKSGFAYRREGTEEDFERLWLLAFHDEVTKKGVKR
jgi:hypothetical protein